MRLDLLPTDAQPALREGFRQYLDARLAVYRHARNREAARAEVERCTQLQGEIWGQAVGSWVHMLGLAVALAAALYVILDMEYPRLGLIQVSAFDQALVDLRQSMQ